MGGRHRPRVWAWFAALAIAAFAADAAPPESKAAAGHAPPQGVMAQQANHFLQTVAATPADRPGLVKRHFSPAIIARNGEEGLLETFAMLAEVLGPGVETLVPAKVTGNDKEAELQYTLADGRRILLGLTVTDASPALIEKFRLMPLPPEVSAVSPDELSAAIAERVTAESEAGRFSGSVLVARGDAVIHAQAVGMADRKAARPVTLDTPINLGSMNKMFTAIAIAQLQAAGKLDWQDTVGKHLPDFPSPAIRDQVTIHQLLTHTSGVGSYWNEAYAARKNEIDSQQGFLSTFVDQPLLFAPGTGMEYSNGGPVILGLIIEKLAGMSYYDYVRQHIYHPAGMAHAGHFRSDDTEAGFAVGYLPDGQGGWQDNFHDLGLRGSAAGGGYASARDLRAFSRALSQERLLSKDQLETLWKPQTKAGPVGYGYLFAVGNSAGHRWVGHNGGAPGIAAEFLHYPEDGLVVVVLANQDNAAMAMREWIQALVEASLYGPDHP
jgi:CubicO group peptidase (beta-lactamase class C family)